MTGTTWNGQSPEKTWSGQTDRQWNELINKTSGTPVRLDGKTMGGDFQYQPFSSSQPIYQFNGGNMSYNNPTAFQQINPQFGSSSQFNIPAFGNNFDFEQQRAENQSWLTGYTNAINGQPTYGKLNDVYSHQFMIPELMDQMSFYNTQSADLANQLSRIPQNVAQTSTNSLMGQAQLDNMVQAKSKPVYQALQTTTNAGQATQANLQAAQGMKSEALKMEMAQLDKELMPWERSYDLMTVMQAREAALWDSSKQRELDRLISNQAAGLKWTTDEANRANELLIAREGYKNALDRIAAQGDQDRQTKKAPVDLATLYRSIMG